jgi:DNA-binding response OmpR family regulator
MNSPKISRPDLRPIRLARKLMVAHSDYDLLDDLAAGLSQSGFEVHKSTSGVGCVEKLRQDTTDVLILDPDLLWGGSDGVLNVMATSPNLATIPVLLLISPNTCSTRSNKLRTLVSEIVTMPTSHETIAERCVELAEWKIVRSLTHPIAASLQPS